MYINKYNIYIYKIMTNDNYDIYNITLQNIWVKCNKAIIQWAVSLDSTNLTICSHVKTVSVPQLSTKTRGKCFVRPFCKPPLFSKQSTRPESDKAQAILAGPHSATHGYGRRFPVSPIRSCQQQKWMPWSFQRFGLLGSFWSCKKFKV